MEILKNYEADLAGIIGKEYFLKMEPNLKEKLATYIRKNENYRDQINVDVENFKAQAEHTQFELETSIKQLNHKIKSLQENELEYENELLKKDKSINDYEKIIKQKDENLQGIKNEYDVLQHKYHMINIENQNKDNLILEKERLLKIYENDIKSVTEKILSINRVKNESLKLLDEENKKGILLSHENFTLKLKLEHLNKQIKILEDEITHYNQDYNDNLQDKLKQINSLTIKCEDLENLWKISQKHNDILKEKMQEIENKNNELLQGNLKLELELMQKVGELTDELDSSKDKCRVLSDMNKEYETKFKELRVSLENVGKVLDQTREGSKLIELEFKNMKKCHEDLMKDKNTKIESLEKELSDTLKQVAELRSVSVKSSSIHFPSLEYTLNRSIQQETAHDTNILSIHHLDDEVDQQSLTYSDLLKKYVSAVKELDDFRLENRKLNDSMECILQEINRKAPVLMKQGHEYKKLLRTVEIISQELDDAKTELQKARMDSLNSNLDLKRIRALYESIRKRISEIVQSAFDIFGHIKRNEDENVSSTSYNDEIKTVTTGKRLRTTSDNNYQTSYHLKQPLEDLPEYFESILSAIQDPRLDDFFNNFTTGSRNSWIGDSTINISSTNFTDFPNDESSTITAVGLPNSRALVSFDNDFISQQQLLNVTKQIEILEKEITRCKEINGDQLKLINTLKNQNEHFQKLLNDNGLLRNALHLDDQANRHHHLTTTDEDNKSIMLKMTTELQNVKKSYIDRENELNKKIQEFSAANMEIKIDNSKLSYQLQVSEETGKRLDLQISELRLELDELKRENFGSYNKLGDREVKLSQLQKELSIQKQLVNNLNLQIKRSEAECQTLKSEIDYLTKEKTSIDLDAHKFDAILDNIKNLRESFDLTEKESFGKIATQNVALQEECKEYKLRYETLTLETSAKIRDLEKRLRDIEKDEQVYKHKTDTLENEKVCLSEKVISIKKEANEKLRNIVISLARRSLLTLPKGEIIPNIFQESVDESYEQTASTQDGILNEFLNALINDSNYNDDPENFSPRRRSQQPFSNLLRIKDEEIAELKNMIKKSDDHVACYQDMTQSLEAQLKQSHEMVENLEKLLEKQIESNQLYENSLSVKISELESELNESRIALESRESEHDISLSAKDSEKATLSEKIELLHLRNSELQRCIDRELAQKRDFSNQLCRANSEIDLLKTTLGNVSKLLDEQRPSLLPTVGMEVVLEGQGEDTDDRDSLIYQAEQKMLKHLEHMKFVETQNTELRNRCETLQKFCDELNAEISKLKKDWDEIMIVDYDKDVTIKDIEDIFKSLVTDTFTTIHNDDILQSEIDQPPSCDGGHLVLPDKAQNLIKYINYLKHFNKTSLEETELLKIETATYNARIDSLESEIRNLKCLLEEKRNDNRVYELQDKVNALSSELEEKMLEIRLLNNNNLNLRDRYVKLVEEHSKTGMQEVQTIKTVEELTVDNQALAAENTALKNTINRLEERCIENSRKLASLQGQLSLSTENRNREEEEARRLKVEIEETSLKLAVYVNKDQVNEDKFREISTETESMKGKIEEIKMTNFRLKGIARKYKQLFENSQGLAPGSAGTSESGGIAPDAVSTSAVDQQAEMRLMYDTNLPSEDSILIKRKYDEVVNERESIKMKCDDLQKDLEEKNLRLASLKSQYEARFKKLKEQLAGSAENLALKGVSDSQTADSITYFTSPLSSSSASTSITTIIKGKDRIEDGDGNSTVPTSTSLPMTDIVGNENMQLLLTTNSMTDSNSVALIFATSTSSTSINTNTLDSSFQHPPPKANIRPFSSSVYNAAKNSYTVDASSMMNPSMFTLKTSYNITGAASGPFTNQTDQGRTITDPYNSGSDKIILPNNLQPYVTGTGGNEEFSTFSSSTTNNSSLLNVSTLIVQPSTSSPTSGGSGTTTQHHKPAVSIKPLTFSHYSPLTRSIATSNTTIGIAAPNVQYTAEFNSSGLVIVNPFNIALTTTASSTTASIDNLEEDQIPQIDNNEDVDLINYNDGMGQTGYSNSLVTTAPYTITLMPPSSTDDMNVSNLQYGGNQQISFHTAISSTIIDDEQNQSTALQPSELTEEPGPSNMAHVFKRGINSSTNLFSSSNMEPTLKQIVSPLRNTMDNTLQQGLRYLAADQLDNATVFSSSSNPEMDLSVSQQQHQFDFVSTAIPTTIAFKEEDVIRYAAVPSRSGADFTSMIVTTTTPSSTSLTPQLSGSGGEAQLCASEETSMGTTSTTDQQQQPQSFSLPSSTAQSSLFQAHHQQHQLPLFSFKKAGAAASPMPAAQFIKSPILPLPKNSTLDSSAINSSIQFQQPHHMHNQALLQPQFFSGFERGGGSTSTDFTSTFNNNNNMASSSRNTTGLHLQPPQQALLPTPSPLFSSLPPSSSSTTYNQISPAFLQIRPLMVNPPPLPNLTGTGAFNVHQQLQQQQQHHTVSLTRSVLNVRGMSGVSSQAAAQRRARFSTVNDSISSSGPATTSRNRGARGNANRLHHRRGSASAAANLRNRRAGRLGNRNNRAGRPRGTGNADSL